MLVPAAPEFFSRKLPPTLVSPTLQARTHSYHETQKPPGKVLYTFPGVPLTDQGLSAGNSGS
jgi:hypothetical protein